MNVKRCDIEIMSPAGDFESLTAAGQGGADAVYFGLGTLNMRARSAHNFTLSDLPRIIDVCAQYGLRSYLTLNTVMYDSEQEEAYGLIDAAKQAGVSAIIASDMLVIQYARARGMEVHLSTQLNISNVEALRFYAAFADVVVLSRELNLFQVAHIHKRIEQENITGPAGQLVKLEMFCHGALCMAVSGKCYLSLHEYNAAANRGSCYQLCRRGYTVTDNDTGRQLTVDNEYIMSPKDLCTIGFLDHMMAAGVRVLKIEGRARSAEYVKTVTSAYSRGVQAVVDGVYTPELVAELTATLQTVFNRGFWNGYYQGARLGEWSAHYGNRSTKQKTYVAKATNYFSNLGVAEFLMETGVLQKGDEVLIVGPTTGVVEDRIREIRVDLQPVEQVGKGNYFSITVPQKIRRADKLYKIEEREIAV
ncbi:MAG: U32 family peptidase [Prevotellaceae bacterium]|jgi:putative protease|nr:U32 family peptidase [Prevotellaceae bacterium]